MTTRGLRMIFLRVFSDEEPAVIQNLIPLRSVMAGVLAAFMVLTAANPAAAAPRRDRQWHLNYLDIEAVHRISTGQGVVVAVIDSGVDASHPDLKGQVLPGVRSDGGSGDGRADENGHGTHVAAVIAATNSGKNGVLGVAPGAKILPIKASEGDEEAGYEAIAKGIRLAVDHGAKVINVSIAGPLAGEHLEAVEYALSKDVVIIAGAGNTSAGHRTVQAPANIPGVIAVTGLDQRGDFWSGSAQGPEAVISAPAEEIVSADIPTKSRSRYSVGDGTSDATAIVSGVAALIRSQYPNLDAANVINRIIRTADDAGPPGRDPQYGFGKINALRALTASVPEVTTNPLLARAEVPDAADDFDVSQYGDRGGLTDQQVMVIGIVIAGLLVLLLIVAVWLLLRWRRRRSAVAVGGPSPLGYASHLAPPGYGPDPPSAPSPGYPPTGTPPPSPGSVGPSAGPAPGYGPSGVPPPPPGNNPPGQPH